MPNGSVGPSKGPNLVMIDVGLVSGGIERVATNILGLARDAGRPIRYLNPYQRFEDARLTRTRFPVIAQSFKYLKYLVELLWSLLAAFRISRDRGPLIIVNSFKSFAYVSWWRPFLGSKVILLMHGGIDARQMGSIKRFAIRNADLVITVTDQTRKQIAELTGRIATLPNAIPADYLRKWEKNGATRGQAKAGLGLEPNDLVFGYVGRFDKQKGLDLLIAAFRDARPRQEGRRRQVRLILCGYSQIDIEEMHALRKSVDTRDLGSIRFYPFAEDPTVYYRAIDVFVLPSLLRKGYDIEGCSIALLEAVFSGCAALASNIGGNREIIIDNETGLLFEANDKDDLAAKIQRIAEDEGLADCLRKNAADPIRSHLPGPYIEAFLRAIESVGA
jgi:glycosyltransferase involved in cell wall biosynthesis